MVIKKYEAPGLTRFSTFVTVNGERVNIDFVQGILYYGKPASYTTKDKAIQDALENTKMFKEGRLRIVSERAVIEPPKEVKIVKEVVQDDGSVKPAEDGKLTFDSLKDLQKYLIKEYKISFIEVRSKDNALAKAASFGLDVAINNNN